MDLFFLLVFIRLNECELSNIMVYRIINIYFLKPPTMINFLVVINAILMASGQILFKKAALFMNSKDHSFFLERYIYNPWLVIAVFVYVLATVLWVYILTKAELSIAYPVIIGLSYVITIFGAYYFFKETVNVYGLLGIFLIIAGLILLNL